MSRPFRVTPPDSPAVSLEDMKSALGLEHDDEDAKIEFYLNAAINRFDGYTGVLRRCLVAQEWARKYSNWPTAFAASPFVDLISAKVTYLDPDDMPQDLDASNFNTVRQTGGAHAVQWARGVVLPSLSQTAPQPVQINFTCGYGAADDVPVDIKTAIIMTAARWLTFPEGLAEGVQEIPAGVSDIAADHVGYYA